MRCLRAMGAALLLVASGAAGASVLSEGSEAFDNGELDQAIEVWQSAVDAGNPSGKVLFNLGNAWYRKGDLPRSIAHYRSAQRLRPRDGHVHHNLALARADLELVPEPVPPTPSWSALATAGELSLLGLLLTLLGSGDAFVWWRWRTRGVAGAGAALVALGLVVSVTAGLGGRGPRIAVVVDQPLPVRDAPAPEAGDLHTLPPGTELLVLRTLGDFHLVQDGRDRRGWVPTNAVLAPGS